MKHRIYRHPHSPQYIVIDTLEPTKSSRLIEASKVGVALRWLTDEEVEQLLAGELVIEKDT